MKPFLVWAGGKSRLVPQLLTHVPRQYGTYYEPFVGGGALFFALPPGRAVLADSNAELMAAYTALRDTPDALIAAFRALLADHSPAAYAQARRVAPTELALPARGARMLYLNRTCFNGLWRVNQRGHFNVPIGHVRHIADADLWACSAALQTATLYTGDAFAVLARLPQRGDLVYLDPPYLATSITANFASYTAGGWSTRDDARLAQQVRRLTQRGVYCIVSAAAVTASQQHYAWAQQTVVRTARLIAAQASSRQSVNELLITNWRETDDVRSGIVFDVA